MEDTDNDSFLSNCLRKQKYSIDIGLFRSVYVHKMKATPLKTERKPYEWPLELTIHIYAMKLSQIL